MSKKPLTYPRFRLMDRFEHGLLIFSFTLLVLTGLPQKYPDTLWGSTLIGLMGGIETTRLIHHYAAILLMFEVIYHAGVVVYKVWIMRVRLTMIPTWQDAQSAIQTLSYNLGLTNIQPRMGRYNFGEKIEYWAVIWGTLIMVITGFILWNPIAATNFLPGQLVPAAKAAHGGEALLATLSIILWHLYNVHVKHFNRSMFTGDISLHEMAEEHAQELEWLESGGTDPLPDPETVRRRQRVFYPVAAIVAIVLVGGMFYFLTFEATAITTVPRQEVEIFVPAPAPSPTP